MHILFKDILDIIQKNSLPGLPYNKDIVHPFYSGLSLANIPDSICFWLNCPQIDFHPLHKKIHDVLLGPYKHVILLLVDGLSLNIFEKTFSSKSLLNWSRFLADSVFIPLTSTVPSTTSSALTTLWTGKFPAEHGLIGYELFLKEFGLIANMISHRVPAFNPESVDLKAAGFDPSNALPSTTIGEHLYKNNIIVNAYQHQTIAFSGLSEMLLKKTQRFSFNETDDLWDLVYLNLINQRNRSTYSYIYWSTLDTLSHLRGPNRSELLSEWFCFAETIQNFLIRIIKSQLPPTLFLICADHGQIATDINQDFDLNNHPDFLSHLVMPPTGESRLPIIFSKYGHVDFIQQYLSSHWDNQFSILPSASVLQSGLLGPKTPHPTTLDRIGDHIIFPSGNAYWWWVRKENQLLGRHGGLSSQEMLVPFFALPIS